MTIDYLVIITYRQQRASTSAAWLARSASEQYICLDAVGHY